MAKKTFAFPSRIASMLSTVAHPSWDGTSNLNSLSRFSFHLGLIFSQIPIVRSP